MKKLLKSEICGSHEQCTGPTGMHCSHEKVNNHDPKKKKTKMLDVGRAKRTSQTLTRSIMRIAEIVISTNETMPPMQMYDLAS